MLLAELAAGIEQELPGLAVARDFRVDGTLRMPLDVDKLRRAVSNIAANARDAMGGRGRLELRVRVEPSEGSGAPSGQLVLELRDEGPGVPAEIRDRVFEPFVTLGKKRGTGLGLAVARRFVEDHGGSLELLPSPEPPGARGALPPGRCRSSRPWRSLLGRRKRRARIAACSPARPRSCSPRPRSPAAPTTRQGSWPSRRSRPTGSSTRRSRARTSSRPPCASA